MKARITVTLKSGVLDPQGKAIEGALTSLGIDGITSVRQGKLFDVEIADGDRPAVEAALAQACERLLANTVIETYRVAIEEGSVAVPAAAAVPHEPAEDVSTIVPGPELAAEPGPIPADVPHPAPAPAIADHDVHPDPVAVTEEAAVAAAMPTEGHP